MKGISSLGHIGIKVKDLDKSIAFYTQTMGFPEMFRLHRDDGRVWLVYLRITDDQYLEIFPEAVQDRAPEPESNGINHFCLTVENIEEVVRQLSGKGIPYTYRSRQVPTITGRLGSRTRTVIALS